MGWRWAALTTVLEPWLDSEPDDVARGAVLRIMAELAEHADTVTGDEMPGQPPLIRSYVVEDAGVRLIWLRAEQFRALQLVKIEPIDPT